MHHNLLIVLTTSAVLLLTGHAARGDEPKAEPTAASSIDDGANLIERRVLFDFYSGLLVGATHSANGLGIDVAPAEAALRAQLGLGDESGLIVTAAPEGSIGAKAGLKLHDVIVRIGDANVADAAKLSELLDAAEGKSVILHVLRGGKATKVEATPKKPEAVWLNLIADGGLELGGTKQQQDRYRIGVTLAEADDTLRTQLRLAAGEGLVVTEVIKDSPAAQAGVQTHDVLTVLDGKRLTTVEAINAQIQEIQDRDVELRLLRGGKEMTVSLAPRKTSETTFKPVRLYDLDVAVHGRHWNLQNCLACHDPGITLHGLGQHYRFDLLSAGQSPAEPQQQIESLKQQLGQMHKTLAELEASLKPVESPKAEADRE